MSMVTRADWLNERGQDYISRIQQEQCSFLGEIGVSPPELEELFSSLRRLSVFRTDEQLACLTIAAVNAAFQAPEDETSFIQLFLRRMETSNKPQWDNVYGPGIE